MAVCFVLVWFVLIFVLYRIYLVPKMVDYTKAYAVEQITQVINDSVFCAVGEVDVNSLVNVQKDSDGNVVLIATNSPAVSVLSGKTVQNVQKSLCNLSELAIEIPLGTLSTSPVFMGMGPKMRASFSPITHTSCRLQSTFTQAGINQTLHKIYLDVIVTFDMVIPTCTTSVNVETPVLICENVIIGNVPEIYFNGNK